MARELPVIGTVTITEAGEPITENHTSYAADHRTYTVQPGTYDVTTDGYWVFVEVDVIQSNSTLYNGFFGNNFSSDADDKVQASTKHYQLYDYQVAEAATEDQPKLVGGTFRLADGWVVQIKHTTIRAYGNQPECHHTSRKIVKTETAA